MKNHCWILVFVNLIFTQSLFAQTDSLEYVTKGTNSLTGIKPKSRIGLTYQPMSIVNSGIELGLDWYAKNGIRAKVALGCYLSAAPQSSTTFPAPYQNNDSSYTLRNFQGFKIETEVGYRIGRKEDTKWQSSIGVFCEYRQSSADFQELTGVKKQIAGPFRIIKASALFVGPFYQMQRIYRDKFYIQALVGPGFVFPFSDHESQSILDKASFNPYKNQISLKINLGIGIFLN